MRFEPQVLVDVRPLPQSAGRVMDGGDCGLCCIAGIFGLGTVLEAYELVEGTKPPSRYDDPNWSKRQNMNANRMQAFLESTGLPCEELIPTWDRYKPGLIESWENPGWRKSVLEVLKSGKVITCSIRYVGRAPGPPHSWETQTDHQVIINGYRERAEPLVRPGLPAGCSSIEEEFRIGCSAKGDWWCRWDNLLYYHHPAPLWVIDPGEARSKIRRG